MKPFDTTKKTVEETTAAAVEKLSRRAEDVKAETGDRIENAKGRMASAWRSFFSSGPSFKASTVSVANDIQKRSKEAGKEAWGRVSEVTENARKTIDSYQLPSQLTSQAMNVVSAAASGTARKLLTADGRKAIKESVNTTRKVGTLLLLDPRVRVALIAAATIGVGYAVVQAARSRQDEAAEIARIHGKDRVAVRKKMAAERRSAAKEAAAKRRAERLHARTNSGAGE